MVDCHANPKALGLGSGIYNVEANFPDGSPIDFELERFVNEDGNHVQGIAHENARPFNKQELQKISRVGACLGCYKADKAFWDSLGQKTGIMEAPTDEVHQKAIRTIFERAAKN